MMVAVIVSFSVATIAYTGYRFINFFRPAQTIVPLGIPQSEYRSFYCGSIRINTPVTDEFGAIPVPCTDLRCDSFIPRGDQVEEGFKAKSNP
jgi:hypothetical protein